jgi:hypothetical protein
LIDDLAVIAEAGWVFPTPKLLTNSDALHSDDEWDAFHAIIAEA